MKFCLRRSLFTRIGCHLDLHTVDAVDAVKEKDQDEDECDLNDAREPCSLWV